MKGKMRPAARSGLSSLRYCIGEHQSSAEQTYGWLMNGRQFLLPLLESSVYTLSIVLPKYARTRASVLTVKQSYSHVIDKITQLRMSDLKRQVPSTCNTRAPRPSETG